MYMLFDERINDERWYQLLAERTIKVR